ncbi:TIGR03087 family PEP-CTERM/XrtA system glycosyltransferase [Thiohalocapsa sp.]|uniref:TIGR03087 family PEP-CTERM/XrtA system glycosyltransferase n=1 Tax=Thiohalocapsa sp. TaxID=2497641 RepID=UPI0025DA0B01|nr:TIGR03087 family PEP-CTERM/XrtA system glycosyltransferase [Thiohalocapsa sp.]
MVILQAASSSLQPREARDVPDLLLLCHRIPYPPDKGDKIRSYRWLMALAQQYRVHLGAFVDDASDWAHLEQLRCLCAEICLRPLPPLRARLRGLSALFTGGPLTVACYRDHHMAAWVDGLAARRHLSHVVVFSSAMAQYAPLRRDGRGPRCVLDFVDVDADKWAQFARRSRWPMAWLYARESRTLLSHDSRVAQASAASLFVSAPETALFKELSGVETPLTAVPNGVDVTYFAPCSARPSPFADDATAIVFTGAMDYWANIDAVRWFAAAVWPLLRERHPHLRFYVVGARPSRQVRALACDDIVVSGRVPDVRPYLQHAAAVVAPMRIARGIQNKLLEGMAMARPVVTTSMGLQGLDAVPGRHLLVADEPMAMADGISAILHGAYGDLGVRARGLVCDQYDWPAAMARFLAVVAGDKAIAELSA